MSHQILLHQLLSQRTSVTIHPATLPLSNSDPTYPPRLLPLLLLPNLLSLHLFFTKLRSWTILDNPSDFFTAKIGLLYSAPLRMALEKPKHDGEQHYFHLGTGAIVSTLATLVHPFTPHSLSCCFWKARTSPDEPPCTVHDRHIFSFIPFCYCLVAPPIPK